MGNNISRLMLRHHAGNRPCSDICKEKQPNQSPVHTSSSQTYSVPQSPKLLHTHAYSTPQIPHHENVSPQNSDQELLSKQGQHADESCHKNTSLHLNQEATGDYRQAITASGQNCQAANTIVNNQKSAGRDFYEAPVIDPHKEKLNDIWECLKTQLEREYKKLLIPKMPWLDWELDFKDYFVDLKISYKDDDMPLYTSASYEECFESASVVTSHNLYTQTLNEKLMALKQKLGALKKRNGNSTRTSTPRSSVDYVNDSGDADEVPQSRTTSSEECFESASAITQDNYSETSSGRLLVLQAMSVTVKESLVVLKERRKEIFTDMLTDSPSSTSNDISSDDTGDEDKGPQNKEACYEDRRRSSSSRSISTLDESIVEIIERIMAIKESMADTDNDSSDDFDDIFCEYSGNNWHGKMANLELNELFKKRGAQAPTRILIEGSAGYGKSTLASKLCFDHANGEEYIRHFEVVILLHLAYLENTLDELIINTLGLEDYGSKDILEAIKVNQSKVLFILDGFDELPLQKQTSVLPLLKSKRFQSATIIITSRVGCVNLKTQREPSYTNLLRCMDIRIVIQGLTEENKIKFLQLYLHHNKPDKLVSTIEAIKKKFFRVFQKGNENLFDCPLYLLLLVIVAEEEDINSIQTKTDLMKRLFNIILRRMFSKNGMDNQKCDFFHFNQCNPPTYVRTLNNFGCLAMKKAKKKMFSFLEEDICACCDDNDTIIKLGILTKKDRKMGLKPIAWFEPVHLSFVEFSIAYHLWITLTLQSKLDIFFKSRDVYRQLNTEIDAFIPFLAGLCGRKFALLLSDLGNTPYSEFWLEELTKSDIVHDIIEEGVLKSYEIAIACVPLAPQMLHVSEFYDVHSTTLQETLINAQKEEQLMYVILEIDGAEKQTDETSNCKIKVYASEFEDMQQEVWKQIVTYQNISITDVGKCSFVITLRETSLDEQLEKLSFWMVIEGLPSDKPISKVVYKYKKHRHREILPKITELISKDVVESIRFDSTGLIPSEPSWNDFFSAATNSKHLLDISIDLLCAEEPIYVDLSDFEKKSWRKIELLRKVVPYLGTPSDPLDLKNAISFFKDSLSSFTDYLAVNYLPSQAYVFMKIGTLPAVLSLRQVKVTLLEIFEMASYSDYLKSLRVVAVTDHRKNERKTDSVGSKIFSTLLHCHPKVRLEFNRFCSEEFLRDILVQLLDPGRNEIMCSEKSLWRQLIYTVRTKIINQELMAAKQLDTLMLSHDTEMTELSEATVNLLKQALLSGRVRHLWVSGDKLNCGLVTPEFVKHFPESEGFVSKLGQLSEEKPPWWDDDDYFIQISASINE